ncbi:bifunctional metallophosphatase/5'-nucleotidase [Fulvimarina sp. MAC3]|uniref:bifunctional metallophosphatase/5'-nucleotidase n=1 Tax=Fulvimarina sp. MAC3 TaxID=3148887 RepID=UPI0031FBCE4B
MRRLAPFAAAFLLSAAIPASAETVLTILHTNDVHSHIQPINKYDAACGEEDAAENACFGGAARMLTAINTAKDRATNPILVDGGDQFQGTLFYNQYKGKATAEMMNALGYEAMVVGNHEFDDGPEVLRDFIAAVDFPVVMANADVSNEPALADVIEPSAIIKKAGKKIALVGVTPSDNDQLASPGEGVTFSDPVEALKTEVARLEGEGIDTIILLSHSGYEVDKRIAGNVPGIDVIVGGHSHTLLSNTDDKASGPYPTVVKNPDGIDVPIVQAYAYGKYLGELVVTFGDDGNVLKAEGAPILLDASIPEDEALKARIAELAKPLEEIQKKVIGKTGGPIDGGRDTCRAGECQMGNLVADAMLDRVADQGVQLAITNGGGLRASFDEGDVTLGEILTVLPFGNTLSTFKLKGSDLKAALENGVSQVEEGGGRFPQIAGMRITWSPHGTAGEDRITSIEIADGKGGFTPYDPDATYLVVSNNYMRTGGDGYSVFEEKGSEAYDFGPLLADVLTEYLQKDNSAYEPYTDGRIAKAE